MYVTIIHQQNKLFYIEIYAEEILPKKNVVFNFKMSDLMTYPISINCTTGTLMYL